MTIDYIVASLPPLAFDAPAPITLAAFEDLAGDSIKTGLAAWADIETQLRTALGEGRGGSERFKRPAEGCSVYWKGRVLECFAEKDVAKRDELLDRVWWDAAGELTKATDPLGAGALATYAVRLRIAAKRTEISKDAGNAAFDRLTATTKEAI